MVSNRKMSSAFWVVIVVCGNVLDRTNSGEKSEQLPETVDQNEGCKQYQYASHFVDDNRMNSVRWIRPHNLHCARWDGLSIVGRLMEIGYRAVRLRSAQKQRILSLKWWRPGWNDNTKTTEKYYERDTIHKRTEKKTPQGDQSWR